MNTDKNVKTIVSILERSGPVPSNQFSYRYLDAGHIDSLAIMGFIMEIEEVFNIELSPEDTQSDEFRSVGGLANLINQKINE